MSEPFWPRKSPHFLACRTAVRPFAEGYPAVTVGLSGGADSFALTAALAAEYGEHKDRITAVSVDHGLQPGSREVSERAVEAARQLGVAGEVVTVDVPEPTEAAARVARYQALGTERPVLVAHTADDQAETLLLGTLRGKATGMRKVENNLWRPFLSVRRADTAGACRELGYTPWQDPQNADARFRRVAIRTQVLPLLRDIIGGDPTPALAQAAADVAADDELLSPAHLTDDCAELAALAEPQRRRAIASWLNAHGVPVSRAAIRGIDKLCTDWHGQGPVAVQSLEVLRRGGKLSLVEAKKKGHPTMTLHEAKDYSVPDERYGSDVEAVLLSEDDIARRVQEMADKVSEHYRDAEDELLLVCVLKGAAYFLTDFSRALSIPSQLEFMAVSSYGNSTSSSGVVRILKDLDRDIADRDVLIVEDIIDSGLTLSWLIGNLENRNPKSLQVVSLLRKPEVVKAKLDLFDVGFDIPNEFVVGYGLDFAERYRDLPFVGTLHPSVYSNN